MQHHNNDKSTATMRNVSQRCNRNSEHWQCKFIWTKRTKHKLQAPANFQKSTPSWQLTFLKQKSARCIRIQIWNQKNNLQNLQLYDVPKIPITTSIHIEGILHHEKKMHSPARSKQSRQFIQTQITTLIGRKFLEN